jgi:lysozyme family protein
MSNFDKAIKLILKHEGGYVNNPNDNGGPTAFGVSLAFLKGCGDLGDFDHDGDVDIEDIKNMTVDQATLIYKTQWWDKYKYSAVTDLTIATKIFDFSVNMGSSRAHKLLQTSLNKAFGLKLTVDGVLGNATFSMINAVKDGSGEQQLLDAYCNEAWMFYQQLILNNPKFKVFEKGWKNRAYSIKTANSIV